MFGEHTEVAPACRRNRPLLRAAALLAGFIPLAGCGSALPTPEQAARAILATQAFVSAKAVRLASVHAGSCGQALESQPEWNRWVHLGLASAVPFLSSSGPICRLALEENVARETQNWIHRVPDDAAGSGEMLLVPVAVRNLLAVSEILPSGAGAAEAQFEWQWRLNVAGQRLGLDTTPKRGWAVLVLEEGGWRASKVEIAGE